MIAMRCERLSIRRRLAILAFRLTCEPLPWPHRFILAQAIDNTFITNSRITKLLAAHSDALRTTEKQVWVMSRLDSKIAFTTGVESGRGRAPYLQSAEERGVGVTGFRPGRRLNPATREKLEQSARALETIGRCTTVRCADMPDHPTLKSTAVKGARQFGDLAHGIFCRQATATARADCRQVLDDTDGTMAYGASKEAPFIAWATIQIGARNQLF